MASKKQMKVTLIKSGIGRKAGHRDTVRALGLRRLHHSVVLEDNPTNRGMVNKIDYLLSVEEVS